MSTPYITSPSVASQESYSTLPGELSFSPLQDTYEGWSSPQSQAVPDTCPSGYLPHGLPIHKPGEHQDSFSGYPVHGLPIHKPGEHQDSFSGYPVHGLPIHKPGEHQDSFSGYPIHGLPIHKHGEHQDWFSGYPVHGLPLQNPGYPPECPTPETPFSAQPEEDNDYKVPPHILENMDNSQLLGEHHIYFDHTPGLKFRYGQLEKLNQILNEEKVEQNGKLKAQEEEIEKLQKMVNERDKKIRMHEKKERAHLKKRKGKNPFGLRSRVKK